MMTPGDWVHLIATVTGFLGTLLGAAWWGSAVYSKLKSIASNMEEMGKWKKAVTRRVRKHDRAITEHERIIAELRKRNA